MTRSIISLIAGLVLAIAAVIVFNNRLAAQRNQLASTGPVTTVVHAEPTIALAQVVVAARDIDFGTELTDHDVMVVDWPDQSKPLGAFATSEEIFTGSQPPRLMRPLVKGEPLLRSKVTGFADASRLSDQLHTQKRAATIRVNDVSGVAGFLAPGDRVDVLLTRQIGEDAGHLVTDLILQNTVILGIDQTTQIDADKPNIARTVTVEVEPGDAQKLALGQQAGTLSLALRNGASTDRVQSQQVSTADLDARTQGAHQNPQPTVRVRRGVQAPTHERVRK